MTQMRLTESAYWEAGYADSGDSPALDLRDFRQLWARRLVETIESLGLDGQSVLEVGAGNSAVLTYLAARHGSNACFSGLDYSEAGCRMLTRRAEREKVSVAVHQQDLFAPSPDVLAHFDLVYSLGVVEHFANLSGVLEAKARLLVPGGRMLTIIPNMAGVLGSLTQHFNPAVYELHVPHDLDSLVNGHAEANLEVEKSGYIGSTNFGILSSCFVSDADHGRATYMWLSRLSKLLWFVESRAGDLPHSACFSPYIYTISHFRR